MRNIEDLKNKKKELKLTYNDLSAATGIPVPTLQKIFSGKTDSPRYHTIQKLEDALFGPAIGTEDGTAGAGSADSKDWLIGETAAVYQVGHTASGKGISPYIPYKPQGTYTVSDLEKLPEEERFELIDGVLIRMEAPSAVHQQLVVFLVNQLSRFAEEEDCDCLVLCSPFDVQLDRDDRTMVQPDVLVICDENNVNEKRGIGAPDLCIEVLSASTRSKDQLLKKYKYQRAGVREFWIVDPDAEQVIVHLFENKRGAEEEYRYSFEDRIPVGICGGKHSIDFSKRIPAFLRRRRKEN